MNQSPKAKTQPASVDPPEMDMADVLRIIHQAIDGKKGEDILILDLTESVDYLDYLVICTGQTEIHNRAITDEVNSALARYDIIPDGLHGHRHGGWILLDYGVLVVHAFLAPLREFYRLDELWAAGKVVEI
jgi:ribosome-associated protein